MNEAGKEKKKEIDRKASKNRKIRYIVHEKIVNFMTPIDNLSLTEGKESILSTLFGQREVSKSKEVERIDDGIRLI